MVHWKAAPLGRAQGLLVDDMYSYALKKILFTVPTIWVLTILIFSLIRLAPGDPAVILVGDLNDPAALAEARERLGLNESYVHQYVMWTKSILTGDLGVSAMTGQGVLDGIISRFAVTAQIVVLAMISAAFVAIPAGLYAAWRHNSLSDFCIAFLSNIFLSVPSFWVGLVMVLVFGVFLEWLPAVGYVSVSDNVSAGLKYMIMPILSLVFLEAATLTRIMRANSLEVLQQEYVTHARAKGLPERIVLSKHVFKNAFGPTLTLIGVSLGSLLGGAAVIETVFTVPGLGRFLVDAIYARDYAVVQGVLLFVACVYVVVNLIVDLLYPVFDPRVRL